MAETRPEFVIRFQSRGLFHTLFALAVLACLWLGFVLFGESQDWGDDPGRWTGIPTLYWAILALLLMGIFILYALAVLTIRERPGRVYRIEDAHEAPENATPSFLQPQTPAASPEPPPPGQP